MLAALWMRSENWLFIPPITATFVYKWKIHFLQLKVIVVHWYNSWLQTILLKHCDHEFFGMITAHASSSQITKLLAQGPYYHSLLPSKVHRSSLHRDILQRCHSLQQCLTSTPKVVGHYFTEAQPDVLTHSLQIFCFFEMWSNHGTIISTNSDAFASNGFYTYNKESLRLLVAM